MTYLFDSKQYTVLIWVFFCFVAYSKLWHVYVMTLSVLCILLYETWLLESNTISSTLCSSNLPLEWFICVCEDASGCANVDGLVY